MAWILSLRSIYSFHHSEKGGGVMVNRPGWNNPFCEKDQLNPPCNGSCLALRTVTHRGSTQSPSCKTPARPPISLGDFSSDHIRVSGQRTGLGLDSELRNRSW